MGSFDETYCSSKLSDGGIKRIDEDKDDEDAVATVDDDDNDV